MLQGKSDGLITGFEECFLKQGEAINFIFFNMLVVILRGRSHYQSVGASNNSVNGHSL